MPSEELPFDTVLANKTQGDIYRGFVRKTTDVNQPPHIHFFLSHLLKADVTPGGIADILQPTREKKKKKNLRKGQDKSPRGLF